MCILKNAYTEEGEKLKINHLSLHLNNLEREQQTKSKECRIQELL